MIKDINDKEIEAGQTVIVAYSATNLLRLNVLSVSAKTVKCGGTFKNVHYEGSWKPTAIMILN